MDRIIQFNTNSDVNTLHIHFENGLKDDIKVLILESLIIKLFNDFQLREKVVSNNDNYELTAKKRELQLKINRLSNCPEGAIAKNGGNKIYKEWILNKKSLNCLLTFYNRLNNSSKFINKALINSQVGLKNEILNLFKHDPFATDIIDNDYELGYVYLNAEKSLNEIDVYENLLDALEIIVLFDCESKKLMLNYSLEEINKWNEEFGTKFQQYLIITFGKDIKSFQNIKNKIAVVKDRFKIPIEKSYVVLSSEVDILLNRKKKERNPIEFVGFESSSFWDTFLLETSIKELYELRSIKMMNIYSLCFTQVMKNYILTELFSNSESSKLISHSTKQALLELREDDFHLLKDALTNTLDIIIESDLKNKAVELINNDTLLIVDDSVIRDQTITSEIITALSLIKSNKLITWSSIDKTIHNPLLILSYRDQGKFQNYFYPNILESLPSKQNNGSAILFKFFFENQYQWSRYYLLKEYYKYINHRIRQEYFSWNKLKSSIEAIRPKTKSNIDWNLESEYSYSENRETYKVKLRNERAKIYNSSDLFIIRNSEESIYKVNKISNLLTCETNEEQYFVQNLDEIQENINIYEKIVDFKQQEEELNIIRKQFELGDESIGRLWKILLKRHADSKGVEDFYYELKIFLESKKLKIVSFFHFKNSWINPQSESIAPLSKRVFLDLCEYLGIPKIYFIIIQRIRNAAKQSSRQSTRQMNQLLEDLFNDGCFNEGVNTKDIIDNKLSFYKANHPLDELGIDENYLLDNLVTLTELIKPELKLLELVSVEKIDQ